MNDYQELKETHKIVAVGQHTPEGIGTGTIQGSVSDQDGKQQQVILSGTIVPGLGQHLFSLSAVASMDAVAIFDAVKPRKWGRGPFFFNGAINQLYSFSLKLDDNGKDRALRVEAFDFWHCRMGHISVRCLEILSKVEGNGLSCCGDGLACDVCAIG